MNPMLNPSLTESEIQVSWACIPRVQNQLDSETTGGPEKIPGFPKKNAGPAVAGIHGNCGFLLSSGLVYHITQGLEVWLQHTSARGPKQQALGMSSPLQEEGP